MSLSHIGSSRVLPWSGTPRLVLSFLLTLVDIDLINLYLLMRVLLIVEQHTVDMLGL